MVQKWQSTINLMAEAFDVPAGLLMRVSEDQIEVLVSSETEGNPYKATTKEPLGSSLYCEKVMATRHQLYVKDASQDVEWQNNPDMKDNMVFYLGVPLLWPNQEMFGTICVLDNKRRTISDKYQQFLWNFKDIIETDFKLLVQNEELKNHQLILEELVEERTAELSHEKSEVSKREQEKLQLATAVEQVNDSIVITDRFGSIQYINPNFTKVTGYRSDEIVGKNCRVLKSGKQDKAFYSSMWQMISKNGKWQGHLVNKKKDGSLYEEEMSIAAVLDEVDMVANYVAVKRDVTIRNQIQKQLAKSQKLESIGVLAGGIAHDFNNILTAILANIELSQMNLKPSHPSYMLLNDAKKASIRAQGFTKQLLTFAKGGAPVKKTASLTKVIMDSVQFILRGSSVSCEYSIPATLWNINMDRGQISQVIQNLIINACDAMVGEGLIKIGCENVEVLDNVSAAPGRYVKLTITDNGSGINEEGIDKIFDPYFSTKETGSGLGLAICHSIISQHNGLIEVSSTLGQGTTFSIYLQASTHSLPSTKASEDKQNQTTIKGRVMVMDDDQVIRKVVGHMLSIAGHEITFAEHGEEAISLYGEYLESGRPIDVVVMDLTIPGAMGGQEAAANLLELDPSANLIVASGYSNDPVMAHYQDYGFKAALTKPFEFTELTELIEKVLLEGE